MVVNNGGNYSKHIYIGSQRIVSKLSSSGIFTDTIPTGKKKAYSTDFTAKFSAQTGKIKERYDSLGVVYKGTQQGNAALITSSDKISSPPVQYFFHSDHLGSSSLITDIGGNIVQHLEYIPFGEVFIDERPSAGSWSTPYKFNAKELDEETGLYYYGARYYDPRTSVWISVDPLAEKFAGTSSYVYCHDNPVKFIDPDGKDPYLVYNGAKHILKIYDDNKTPGNFKDDKLIGSYQAQNNVTKSKVKWEDGTYKMVTKTARHTHIGVDKNGVPLDSPKGSYGKGGSYTAETFKETTPGKTKSGMSVHAGREYKPLEVRVTEGCVRTTPEAMIGIDNAIKNYGHLQSIIIQNNRESSNSNSANSVQPGGSDQTYHLKEVIVTAKNKKQ